MRRLVLGVGLALAYHLAGRLTLAAELSTDHAIAIWPPAGVALAGLVLLGWRFWPAVLIGAVFSNATSHEPLLTAIALAASSTGAALVGARLLEGPLAIDTSLATKRDVFYFTLAIAAAAVISAIGTTLAKAIVGLAPWGDIATAWTLAWIRDALGMLIVAPAVMIAARRGPALTVHQIVELIALAIAVGLTGVLVFGIDGPVHHHLNRTYWTFPVLIWAALRFGPREVVTTALVIAAMALWGTARGRGPFAGESVASDLLLLDSFLAVFGTSALLIGAVTSERRESEIRVRAARDELERHVRERTAALARTNAALAAKNEEIESFVYVVSHDLRAPLVNAQGFSAELDRSCHELDQRLRGVALPAEVGQGVREILSESIPTSLRYIGASVTKFQRLIDALLALSRTGRREHHVDRVDMEALVAGTLDSSRTLIRRSGAEIRVGALPPALGDATTLEQVLGNLIANAVTYLEPSRPGLIEVGGKLVGRTAHYWVRDNGLGIPPTARRRVFQVFQRFHPDHANGDGVGLAIVKRVVERHGGRVWLQNRQPVGTTFHFTLPAAVPRSQAA